MARESKKKTEKIIFLYEKMNEYKKSGISLSFFCKENNLNKKELQNFTCTFNCKIKNQEWFSENYDIAAQEYEKENTSILKLSNKYKLNNATFNYYLNHLRYKKIINEYEESKKNSEKQMTFIKIKNDIDNQKMEKIHNPELLEKQNDIELLIQKGVKVIVSPNIKSDKLIKIIELLKDI